MTALRAALDDHLCEDMVEARAPLPVFGELPDRVAAEAVVRGRINTAVPRKRDGTDWSRDFELRVIHRRESSMSRRPYLLRQWGVWAGGRSLPVGYVTEMRAPGLPSMTRLIFVALTLGAQDFELGE